MTRVRVITDRADGVYVHLGDVAELIRTCANSTAVLYPAEARGALAVGNVLADAIRQAIKNWGN